MEADLYRQRPKPWRRQMKTLKQDGLMTRWKITADEKSPYHQVPLQRPRNPQGRYRKRTDLRWLDGSEVDTWMIRKSLAALVSPCQPGGLRLEPFDAYPIPATHGVPHAIDYFVQVYAPGIRLPGEAAPAGFRTPFFTIYFREVLENPMFFEALVALALVLQRFNVETTVRLDVDLVYHVRNVLRRLQTQIASVYEAATDASILTVAALMSINNAIGDRVANKSHLEGLRKMVRLRGGYDCLGWNGYVKAKVMLVESQWISNEQQYSRLDEQRKGRRDSFDASVPHYPNHPFSTALREQISTFPVGFQRLALGRVLRLEMFKCIEELQRLVAYCQEGHLNSETSRRRPVELIAKMGRMSSSIALMTDLSSTNTSTEAENLLSTAAIAITKRADENNHGVPQPFNECRLRVHMQRLGGVERLTATQEGEDEGAITLRKAEADLTLWTAVVLDKTTSKNWSMAPWAKRVLAGSATMTEEEEDALCERFFTVPEVLYEEDCGPGKA